MKFIFWLCFFAIIILNTSSAEARCASSIECVSDTSNPLYHCVRCDTSNNGNMVSEKECRRRSIDNPPDEKLEKRARQALSAKCGRFIQPQRSTTQTSKDPRNLNRQKIDPASRDNSTGFRPTLTR